jgi:MraZ protein
LLTNGDRVFVGMYDYQLDDRGRIPIPPVYRAAFKDGGFVATSPDGCLALHTPDSFERAAAVLDALPEESSDGEDARRDFFANAFPVQPDTQGRIGLTERLLNHATLKKEVRVVGVGRRLEIWDRALWEAGEARRQAVRKAAVNAKTGARDGEGA